MADGVDLQPAVEGRGARLDACARRQRFGAAEIRAVDRVERRLLLLVAQPDRHFQEIVHAGAGSLEEPEHVVHHDPRLDFDRPALVFRQRLALAAGLAQPDAEVFLERRQARSEEHTSELQSLMRISYAVFCLTKKTTNKITYTQTN